MADLGTDFSCRGEGGGDLTPELRTVSGTELVAQDILLRWETPPGGLWYDPDYGTDLRSFVNGPNVSPESVAEAARAEAVKDPRVISATATGERTAEGTIQVNAIIETTEGPFDLVADISSLTVQQLTFPSET